MIKDRATTEMLIQTTLGPITLDALGKVNMHEHIIIDRRKNEIIPEAFHHIEVDRIAQDVTAWKGAGGGAIVDSSPIGAGRNPRFLNEVSHSTQVPIIVSSGFHKLSYYPEGHWLYSEPEEILYDIIRSECTQGVLMDDQHPKNSARSSTIAHMLKIGVDKSGLTPIFRKLLSAVARVSAQTGIPLMIHTEPGVPFGALVIALEKADISPNKVIFCHMGKSFDPSLHETLARDGYYLEFDEMVRPQPGLQALAKAFFDLFEKGLGHSILFAGDLARRSYWPCYGGSPGLAFLLEGLEEKLLSMGFSHHMLDQIWMDNPRNLFLNK